MAGDDNRDRVAIVRHAHRTKGVWLAHRAGNVCVAPGLSVRNRQQRAPAGYLEIRAAKIERKGKLAAFAGEVFFQFAHVRSHYRRRIFESEAVSFFAKM